jgi:hypothetical protein
MPRDGRPHGILWWIGVAVAIVVAVLLFAALQWNYLPRSWRGFAWLAFIGVPVWLAFEWLGDSFQSKAEGRPWWWQALGVLVLIAAIALIVWFLPAAPR